LAAFLPPFLEALRFYFLARLEPLFLPPPDSLFTVAQARAFASLLEDPMIFVGLFDVFGLSFLLIALSTLISTRHYQFFYFS